MTASNNVGNDLGLGLSDYVVHLWRRRLLIAALAAFTVIVTYVVQKFWIGDRFQCGAQLLVRRRTSVNFDDNQTAQYLPGSFKPLVLNESIVKAVKDAYNQSHPREQAIGVWLEKFQERFKVETSTLYETTVHREFSPILQLTVFGTSARESRELMDTWIQQILLRYGNLSSQEASYLHSLQVAHHQDLGRQFADAVSRATNAMVERQASEAEVASTLRQLTAASVSPSPDILPDSVVGAGQRGGSDRNVVSVHSSAADAVGPGLWERGTQVQLELARARQAKDTKAIEKLEAEKAEIDRLAGELQQRLPTLREKSAAARAAEATATAEQARLAQALRVNASSAGQVEASLLQPGKGNDQDQSDIRVIAPPATPEHRAGFSRVLTAIAAGIAMGFVLIGIFSGELYLQTALRRAAATT